MDYTYIGGVLPQDEIITGTVTVEVHGETKPMKPYVIEPKAFMGKNLVELVVVGKGVIAFKAACFKNCANLVSVTIGTDIFVNEFSMESFSGCSSLKTFSYTSVGTYGDIFSTIGGYAFFRCFELEEIHFAGKQIGESAFADCSALKKIVPLGDTKLKSIDALTFQNCVNLSFENFHGDFLHDLIIAKNAFTGCPKIFLYNGQNMEDIQPGAENIFVSRQSEIPDSEFSGKNIKFVHFLANNTHIKIGKKAFQNCQSLQIVSLGCSPSAEIGEEAFEGCRDLKRVGFADGPDLDWSKNPGMKVMSKKYEADKAAMEAAMAAEANKAGAASIDISDYRSYSGGNTRSSSFRGLANSLAQATDNMIAHSQQLEDEFVAKEAIISSQEQRILNQNARITAMERQATRAAPTRRVTANTRTTARNRNADEEVYHC